MTDKTSQRAALFGEIETISAAQTLPYFRSATLVENKNAGGPGQFDPVTIADKNCEQAIRALIEDRFPDDGIVGEEFGKQQTDAEYVWVIDPIDGTRAFICGVPLWGTLVGLMRNQTPIAGAAIQPFIGEAYVHDGHTSTWSKGTDESALKTRACRSLQDAQLMTTTPALFSSAERPAYDALESAVKAVRFGTDWYGYALVASGCADVVIESGLSLYDIAALIPIIEGAGGIVTDWQGNRLDTSPVDGKLQVLALGDAELLPQVLPKLERAAKAAKR
ncbi:MAG: histidinol-phosphatase [Pseudomonadota bacterium]